MNVGRVLGMVGAVCLSLGCSSGDSVVGGDASTDTGTSIDVIDVPVTPDVPVVKDTSPVDAVDVVDVVDAGPPRCGSDADCAGNPAGPACDTSTGQCAACVPERDACPAGQYCVAATHACAAGCGADDDCSAAGGDGGAASGRCDASTHQCVACLADPDCPAGNLCVGNTCVMGCNDARPCPGALACCAGACVDTQSNVAACGACGASCSVPNASPACMNGSCAVGTCVAPNADCDGAAANGCEVNTQSDLAHCGGCGMACAARPHTTATCAAGACAYACEAGFADCDGDAANGCEVDTRSDAANCGRCGGGCSLANATSACVAGSCSIAGCSTGYADCDGSALNGCEANTQADVAHCGACETTCAARPNGAPVCVLGACGVTCLAGYGDCDGDITNGCEANTPTDVNHCGSCGRACDRTHATPACVAGGCSVASCETGYANCDGSAANGCEVNTQTSDANCGACGRACLAGASCVAGACALGAYGSGRDGALSATSGTVTINEVRSPASGAMGATEVELSNPTGFAAGQVVFLHQTQGAGAGAWELRQVTAVAGTRITVESPLANAYSSAGASRAQAVVVPQYTTAAVEGATLVAPAWDGNTGGILALMARDAARVTSGAVVMSERGFRGHPRVSSNYRPGEQGEGTLGYGAQTTAPNGNGGGGGGRTDCDCCWAGGGGGGGHATAGEAGSVGGATCQPGGNGGLGVGAAEQSTIFFGGAGANGGADEDGWGSPGANGGGLIYVASPTITVSSPGGVRANGQVGQNEYNFAGCGSGGGGGGAGGAIYLRAATATLGAGLVTATGGVGGDEPGNCGRPGGVGSAGRVTVRGAATGTTSPTFTATP